MNTTQVAVDLAKSVFEVAVSHRPGRVHESARLSGGRFQKFFDQREPVEILMEACGTAHHWGRTFEAACNEAIDPVPVKSVDQQAIAALQAGKRSDEPDDLRAWALDVERRKGHNVAAVALANKLARVAWCVWHDQRAAPR